MLRVIAFGDRTNGLETRESPRFPCHMQSSFLWSLEFDGIVSLWMRASIDSIVEVPITIVFRLFGLFVWFGLMLGRLAVWLDFRVICLLMEAPATSLLGAFLSKLKLFEDHKAQLVISDIGLAWTGGPPRY